MRMAGQKMTKNNRSRIYEWIEKSRDLLGALLFPPRCFVCDELLEPEQTEGKNRIHPACKEKLIPVESPYCLHCGRPLARTSCAEYCHECIKVFGSKVTSMSFFSSSVTSGRALFLYQGAIKKSMYRFKYSNKREYAGSFARYAVEKYADWIRENQIEIIVPVPMYDKKKRKRGYNQAETFAREFSKQTGIPMDAKLVKRIRDTIPQKGLSDVERKNNMKNAFQKRKSIVQYRHVLVVDDIYTTGATVQAVAQEIKNKGECQVHVLCICIGRDM